ncbi:MAG: DEAD/DEAH box helicase [Janthinobacterium lividum]
MKLEAALDDSRKKLSKRSLRSRLLSFSAWTKSLPAIRAKTQRDTWLISSGDKRGKFSVTEADRQNGLTVYEMMVRYREPGSTERYGALRTVSVRLDATRTMAIETDRAKPNLVLLDLLADLGVLVTFEGDNAIIKQHTDVAFLTGESRLAAAPAGAFSAASYVDYIAHPAILSHPTLRYFVEGADGQPPDQATEGQSDLVKKLGDVAANESLDDVGPSEPQPTADSSGSNASRPALASEDLGETGPSERRPKPGLALACDLDPDQRNAVAMALTERVSLIAGPPGTGKSQVIAALAAELNRRGCSVIVSSTETPAIDVARRRISEMLGPEARVLIGSPAEIAARKPPEIGVPDFDVLIVDEASMMPIEVALPLMTRTSRYVLIGDGRQMRPDACSLTVLDQAEHLQVKQMSLGYHYRSADPTLISPSNLIAYEMKLRTVPTPVVQPVTGLKTHFLPEAVTTTSEKGLVNRGEAVAVAARIQSHLRTRDKRSMGIIAANTAQKELIQSIVSEDLKGSPTRTIEPLFIRTTNEIQGEERDVILISIVYDGRDPEQRFGAFETSASLARLNVMLSRSRTEMAVYTSFADRPGINATMTPGRQTYLLLRAILNVHSEAETRLHTDKAVRALAKRLALKVDCLGVVFGLRYSGDDRYSIGLVLTEGSKTEEHWDTIIQQLQTKGWSTLTFAETDLVTKPKKVDELIMAALAKDANRPT